MASVLQVQGKHSEAEEIYQWGKTEHPDTLTNRDNLALVLEVQGKYEKTEEARQRPLE